MEIQVKEKKQRKSDMRAPHSENIDSKENKHQGLCSTCIHKSICWVRKTSKDTILFCEEFDMHSNLEVSAKSIMHLSRTMKISENENRNATTGLCVNCDNREICKLKQPETGIWHCEEYR